MKVIFSVFPIILLLLLGCSKPPVPEKPMNLADSAEQHIITGLLLLDNSKLQDAVTQCERALALEPKSSSAYSCLSIARNDEKLLAKAKETIQSDLDTFRYHLSSIRILDIEKAKEHYKKIQNMQLNYLPFYHDKKSSSYFLALTYFKNLEFEKTRDLCAKVFKNKDSKYINESRLLWKKVDRIIRALALSEFTVTAKKLVLKDKIKRVDIAVVLEDEIALSKLMKGAFKADRKDLVRVLSVDILDHPNLPQIKVFYKYGLRGLEPKVISSKELFLPDSYITRADFTLLIEDIVSQSLGDKKLKTKFYGNKSIFVDVNNDSYYFNAINTAVARGFLKANINSEFRPHEFLSGVELIEAIAAIKKEIR